MSRVGIVRFLGTNCDRDIWQAAENAGHVPQWLWHEDRFQASDVDTIIVPGGFSYGDYLRSGALAARSPVMDSVREAADRGLPIMGICNGFQILCESGLLPGALVQNTHQKFVDEWAPLVLANKNSHWGQKYDREDKIALPIAHGDGRYYAPEDELKRIEDDGQVWWRYLENPNGSLNDIAGVTNKAGNVAAMMPHPERAIYDWMQGTEGAPFFQ